MTPAHSLALGAVGLLSVFIVCLTTLALAWLYRDRDEVQLTTRWLRFSGRKKSVAKSRPKRSKAKG